MIRLILFLSMLSALSFQPPPTLAATADVGTVIESFVVKQFPDAASYFWVVNETQREGDELVVDMNAVVVNHPHDQPIASRFLLLIVEGRLQGVQNIPLDAATECRPEQEA